MKKLFLFIATMLTLSSVYAQNKAVEVGLEGGMNLYYPMKQPQWPVNKEIGFSAGVSGTFNFSTRSAFAVAVWYDQKKFSMDDVYSDLGTPTQKGNQIAKDITVPFLYRFYFMPEKKVNIFINAGPSFTFRLATNTDYRYSFYGEGLFTPTDMQVDKTKRFDVNAAIGLGAKLHLYKHLSLTVELRQLFWLTGYSNKQWLTAKESGQLYFGDLHYRDTNFGTSYILTGLTYRLAK